MGSVEPPKLKKWDSNTHTDLASESRTDPISDRGLSLKNRAPSLAVHISTLFAQESIFDTKEYFEWSLLESYLINCLFVFVLTHSSAERPKSFWSMFSTGLFQPHQSLHGALHTSAARKSQEALQVGIQLLNQHQGWEGTSILLQRDYTDKTNFL